jgi:BlaI family penicillinase repressor
MKLTEAEWQIMNALWRRHPATAREIMDRLPAGVNWAYTTIKTMLTRLVEKQAVGEVKQGNTSVYEPLVSRRKVPAGPGLRRGPRAPGAFPGRGGATDGQGEEGTAKDSARRSEREG